MENGDQFLMRVYIYKASLEVSVFFILHYIPINNIWLNNGNYLKNCMISCVISDIYNSYSLNIFLYTFML